MALISASQKKIQLVFLISSIFIFILSVFSFIRIKIFIENAQQVNHTNLVKLELEQSFSNLKDLETGQRGYVLTKDSVFLKPFYESEKKFIFRINKLYALTSDNHAQQKNVVRLRLTADKRIAHLKKLLAESETKTISKDRWLDGKKLMDEARSLVDEMMKNEDDLLEARTKRLNDSTFFTPLMTIILIVCSLLILILSYYRINKSLKSAYALQQSLTKNEDFLKQANAELKVSKSQQQSINESLQLKNRELEKMNKELESFAYVSSHDLQEPLRKIQMFVSRIMEKEGESLSDTGKEYFNRMKDSANRMQQLIEDLLTYSRTNTKDRKFEDTDLNQLVAEVKEDFKESLLEKQATIHSNGLGKVTVIPFQFRQLMYNLIGNSLKFSKPGRLPEIRIKSEVVSGSRLALEKLRPEKNYCHISVSDNGIGFDPLYKERIFEVFQRLHGKEAYQGTGIGLAIVKKIVENHEGIIIATSNIDKGTTFDIYIPV
jgi:signal transduction histidine kinase